MNRRNELRGVATVIILMVLTVLLALGVVLLSRTLNRNKVANGNTPAVTTPMPTEVDEQPTTAPESSLTETTPPPEAPVSEPDAPAPEEAEPTVTPTPPPPPPVMPPPPPPPVPSATEDPKNLPPEG